MGKHRVFKTFCVWRNKDDEIIAIDLPAAQCALMMGMNLKTFYEMKAKQKPKKILGQHPNVE